MDNTACMYILYILIDTLQFIHYTLVGTAQHLEVNNKLNCRILMHYT